MKTFYAVCLIGFLPVLALAQTTQMAPDTSSTAKPPPFEPVLAKDHQGLARIGVIIQFDKTTGTPWISALIRGGPAEDFGFHVGDQIIKIDKNYTNTLSKDEVSLALHGEPGTAVELTIMRDDDPHYIIRSLSRRILPPGAQEMVNPPMSGVAQPNGQLRAFNN